MYQYNITIPKIINHDDGTKGNIKEHNRNQARIPDTPQRILRLVRSFSTKFQRKKFMIFSSLLKRPFQ